MLHNVTGLPALSVNGGYSANGLPIGVQLTGNYWREDHILAVADLIEQEVAGWKMPAFSETLTTR
jgi:Asp-tRNA(Asn)/Glu-tRNA(Gln) amidotransferase A subunit family amidase